MGILIVTVATAAAQAAAAPASAQMLTATGGTPSGEGQASAGSPSGSLGLSKFYLQKVTALSYRIVEVRAQDGGTLTPEHLASLQHEFNRLNRQYDVKTPFRVRASA